MEKCMKFFGASGSLSAGYPPFLQSSALQTSVTQVNSVSLPFPAHWAPFCTFAWTSSCMKGNVPIERNQRLGEIVAS